MKKIRLSVSVLAFVALLSCAKDDATVDCVSRPSTASYNTNYVSNRLPLQPLHFIKLPVGSIRPGGWIEEYLNRQRDGLSGHLGEISVWLQKDGNAWLSPDGKGNYGWEEAPYWLKGYADIGYILNDGRMIAEAKTWIEGALNSQRDDGYFGPWIERRGNPDSWGNMIMLWCLQSYYEFSGDGRVIPFMSNYFRWQLALPDGQFLEHYWENSRGGDNLLSVYWLYNRTGEEWLLRLAEKIHANTADWRQESSLPNWHNVNIAQCFREPATWWMQSADSADLQAAYNNFHLIRRTFGQAPGGMFGGDENSRLGYIDPRQGVETCGMVEQMASDEIMLRLTGDPFWADHCEDVAFNTYPAAVMPDFKALRYITAPNMVVSDSKNHYPGIDNRGPFLMMNPFSSRCCQHNHTQGWPYYAGHLWLATPDNGLAAAMFNSCTVNALVADGREISVEETTNYPFDDAVHMRIHTPSEVDFPLYIRIPGWCRNGSLTINGRRVGTALKAGSYARISRTWKDGDELLVRFPMSIGIRRWAVNRNSISVDYGPLTFSLKIAERYEKRDSKSTAISDSHWQEGADESAWPSWEIYPDSPWNYALECDEEHPERSFTVVKKAWPEDNFPFAAESVPIEIRAKGSRVPSWTVDRFGLCGVLPAFPAQTAGDVEELTLIPMGAARLRISAFPELVK